jgi:threonyl-tRNA synthetase
MSTITLTLPDGTKKEHKKGVLGSEVALSIGKKLAEAALSITVNNKVRSLFIPIEEDGHIKINTWDSVAGKQTFWHSTAHLFAHAVSRLYPNSKNTIGPPVEEGFYYDFDDLKITPDDFPKIEAEMQKIVAADFPFEKKDWTLADVKHHQGSNPYKLQLANEFTAAGEKLTAYKDGEFIDLCEGPHIPRTGLIKAFKLLKIAGAFWKGDQKNKQLTRVYGIGFPTQKELDAWIKLQEEVAKRDHRKLGADLELFMFHDWSPGSAFFLPKGMVLVNELQKFIREQYVQRGYDEVLTPQLFNKALFETSGHWGHYKQNMFLLNVDDEEFALKPMNCPSHCLIFKNKSHSYRELPLKIADHTPLHRNEVRGALGGLTRVRKMEMEDAHIFCTPEQIQQEIKGVLEFIKYVYLEVFKMPLAATLATRPADSMGSPELWTQAEEALAKSLDAEKMPYTLKPGDGAFYGPKIDFEVKDALGRSFTISTVQLDFQMPERFELTYVDKDNSLKRPVMIHRAILSTFERFVGLLTEHYAGKFPTWLSPVQARVLPISEKVEHYAQKVMHELKAAGVRVEIDNSAETLNKKIREAQLAQIPYILVVGEKEQAEKSVSVRTRDNKVHGEKKVELFAAEIKKEIENRS